MKKSFIERYRLASGHFVDYRLDHDGEWYIMFSGGIWLSTPSDAIPPELRKRGELSVANSGISEMEQLAK